jgi:hypothetical protein
MKRIIVHCVYIFSTLQSAVLTVRVTAQVQRHFVRKQQFSKPLHAKNDETNDNTELMQPYPVVAVDKVLEIGTTVISAVRR